MHAQIDVPAYDYIDSDDEPKFKVFEYEDEEFGEKGLKVIINESVVTFYPISELARAILEVTDVQVQEVKGNSR